MIKAPLLIFVLFQFASINAQGSAKNLILNYLEDISGQSKTLKALEDQRLATELESKSELSTYDWNTYLNASFYQQDTPPLSPFTSTKQEQWKYGPGIEKKWSSGIKTELSYSILDNTTQFSTNPTFSTLSPTLELKLTSKVFQDILGDASKLEILKTKQKSKWQRFRLQLNKKETIVRALLDYVKLLETNEELRLQNDLCNSVQSQVKKLNQKFKTRSISKREYLLGQKELTLCRANIQTLQKSLREQKNITETTFSINISTYLNTNSEQLFNTIVDQYKLLPKASSKLTLDRVSSIKVLELEKQYLSHQLAESKAKARNNLELELRAGLVGVDKNLSDAQSSLGDADYPFFYAGVKMDFPWEQSTDHYRARAKEFQLNAKSRLKRLKEEQVKNRILTLQSTLETDFDIHRLYLKSVNLSKQVYGEAQKDFRNGRLNFNALSEFNKNLISNQKQLSGHRIQVFVRLVEYLDYFNFFDRYFTTVKVSPL